MQHVTESSVTCCTLTHDTPIILCADRKRWHPGLIVCDELYRRFAVAPAHHQTAHVLTNDAVFRGTACLCVITQQGGLALWVASSALSCYQGHIKASVGPGTVSKI